MAKTSSCIVIFSGGQDSTTCLLWALKKFRDVFALTFNYKQRHKIELDCAKNIINIINDKDKHQIDWLTENLILEHKIIDISFLSDLLETAMIQDFEIEYDEETNLPTTFVPGRNILFLTIAGAYAYQKKIKNLVAGVCQTDYSGYPDCRDATIKSLQATLNLGMDYDIIIHTPLMWKTKAETIKLMEDLGGLELYKYTHTCYRGERPACGECFACQLRLKGFKEVGIEDPLEYKTRKIIKDV
ncbi:MAG: 7-cyano-7-deazaguanine synthase QueC [Candidatus Lokiarchaeota archaeon]|nr:7-cyano-7-deazaguanine synthase QueC [Candidatus Lokiarchaeota archaeon]